MPGRKAPPKDINGPVDLFERQPFIAEFVAAARQVQPGETDVRMIRAGDGGVDFETALRRLERSRVVAQVALNERKVAEHGPDMRIALAEMLPQQRQRPLVRVFRILITASTRVN